MCSNFFLSSSVHIRQQLVPTHKQMNSVPKLLPYFLNNLNLNITLTSILRSPKCHFLSDVPTLPVYAAPFLPALNTFLVCLILVFLCLSLFAHPYYCWQSDYTLKSRRSYKEQVNGIIQIQSYVCGGRHRLAHPPSQDILSSIHRNLINIETELRVKWQLQSEASVRRDSVQQQASDRPR
jgi:hypothetical protein